MRAHHRVSVDLDIPKNIKYYSDIYHFSGNCVNISETPDQIFNAIKTNLGNDFCVDRGLSANSPKSKLWQHGKFLVPSFKKVQEQFDEFVKDKPWVKEFYEFSIDKGVYIKQDQSWLHISQSKGGPEYHNFRNSFSCQNFIEIFSDKYFTLFNELRRKVPFAAGNIVVLRKKYVDSEGHDPYYRQRDLKSSERIGTVIGVLDSTHPWSANGRGSRLVNVLWSASGQILPASINSLKLMDRRDKVVDKLVER